MAIRYRNAMALVFLFGFQSAILVLLSLFMVRWVFIWLLCFFSYLSSYSSFEIVFSFCFVGFVGLTSILGVYGGRRSFLACCMSLPRCEKRQWRDKVVECSRTILHELDYVWTLGWNVVLFVLG